MSTQVLPRPWLAAAALATALAAAGCGDETPDVDDSGAVGPDEPVSESIKVLQVQLEYPLDGVYEEGEDARLFLGIANDGTEDDDLLDVRALLEDDGTLPRRDPLRHAADPAPLFSTNDTPVPTDEPAPRRAEKEVVRS